MSPDSRTVRKPQDGEKLYGVREPALPLYGDVATLACLCEAASTKGRRFLAGDVHWKP